jgi:hypothetical protein
VQGDIRTAPGIAGRREVVGVDLAVDLEDLEFDRLGNPFAVGEPLGVGPGFEHLLGGGVAPGELGHLVEGVIDQGDAGEGAGGFVGQRLVLEGLDPRGDGVAADHGAEVLTASFFDTEGRPRP